MNIITYWTNSISNKFYLKVLKQYMMYMSTMIQVLLDLWLLSNKEEEIMHVDSTRLVKEQRYMKYSQE